jgi:hypothetical protein
VEHWYRTKSVTDQGATLDHHGPSGSHEISVDRHGFVIDLPHLSYRLQ